MPGESDLARLLKFMQPRLDNEAFTFCTLAETDFSELPVALFAVAVGMFREAEGITLIVPVTQAAAESLTCEGRWALITLSVHSNLQAVGFLAAITARFAQAGISVNAVSAFYHDHLFVPWADRERAMEVLAKMSQSAGGR